MKTKHVLYFTLSVIGILSIIMLIFPKDGIRLNDDWVLYFPTFDEMFSKEVVQQIDTDSIIENQISIDSIIPIDDTIAEESIDIEEIKGLITALELPEDKPEALDKFFEKLENIDKENKVRIMHYGDSQIEGDRITSFFRKKMQDRYGGYGLGLCLPVAVYSQFSLKQENSENWYRYTGFGVIDTSLSKKYGPMIAYNRFSPKTDSSWIKPTEKYSAWLSFFKSDIGYNNTKKFKEIYLYYSNAKTKTKISLFSDDNLLISDSLNAGNELFVFKYVCDDYIENLKIEFEGYDSPDIYAVSLEDEKGIFVDNIALRGSSGTVFTTTDGKLLAESFGLLGTDLFILQFGGNSVPYIEDLQAAQHFGNYFYYQLAYLKSAIPDISIIVIGPSDMSTKIKDDYETYPNLENIINSIKQATHKAGGAYWDTYKAMGGKNSMKAWVNADPPLAGTDYIHFTPYGSSIIANSFYNAFILEFKSYKERINHRQNNNNEDINKGNNENKVN